MSVITCSYSEHNIRHLQNDDKGMTLLEVLGVLVVAAIVIGAVMGLMSDTLSSSDNQKELKNPDNRHQNESPEIPGQYTGTDYVKILTESGGLPADMIAGGNKAKNAWVVRQPSKSVQINTPTLLNPAMCRRKTVLIWSPACAVHPCLQKSTAM